MPSSKCPNFLIIVADDLGFSDPACFGGEIRTPNIDRLSQNGIRMTDFHSSPACSPTRAMILTGTDHHIAGLGNMIELVEARKTPNHSAAPQRGMPGYEGFLNERVVTLPELLQDSGYHTIMAGKWHLGLTKERSPYARGFERSLALLPGASNHYDFFPDLSEADAELNAVPVRAQPLHMEDDHYLSTLPEGWYSSDGYGDRMLQYLHDWHQDRSNQPFFSYFPFTAPHWPLQVPKEYSSHYDGVYNDGPEALRQRRLKRLEQLGLVPPNTNPHPVIAEEVKGWEEMTPMEQKMSSKAMEVYAGMVECMDHNIGRVIDYLASIGELDNTFVMFLSDNGAEGAAYEAIPMLTAPLTHHFRTYYNNSLENIGNHDSFVWYGPQWAQAATAPSRLYKMFTTQGGIRVPCVIKYPKLDTHLPPISETFGTVMDIAPTILELAGISHPGSTYQGRKIVPMRGLSMLPWLSGSASAIHPSDAFHGWEFNGRAAIRMGHYKADFIPFPKGPTAWQLYDLSKDPGETNDIAEQEPEKLKELLGLWEQYTKEVGVVPLRPDLGSRWHEAMEEQMPDHGWMEYEFWKKGATQPDRRQEFIHEVKRLEDPRKNKTAG